MAAPVTAIIGLGREVGTAVARRFDKAGHKLMVADLDGDHIEKAVGNLAKGAARHVGDLHTTLGLRNCLAATVEAHGRVDHVVCIPPISKPASLAELEMERFDKSFARSTRGAILTMRIFAEQFKSQQNEPGSGIERIRQTGTITFVLSLAANLANPGQFTAAVTQNALIGVMRAGALELAADKIRCNAIAALRPRAETDEPWLKSRTPLGRAALADEIADAALYLAAPEAAIITGETLMLDGGRTVLGGILED